MFHGGGVGVQSFEGFDIRDIAHVKDIMCNIYALKCLKMPRPLDMDIFSSTDVLTFSKNVSNNVHTQIWKP